MQDDALSDDSLRAMAVPPSRAGRRALRLRFAVLAIVFAVVALPNVVSFAADVLGR
jgi:hypothetical protein